MKKPLYKTTEDGNLVNTKTEKVIDVAEFTVSKGKRGEIVAITTKNGGTKNVHRWNIDEAAFAFGPAGAAPAKLHSTAIARRNTSAAAAVHAPVGHNGRLVHLSRDEALQLLRATRAASDLLFTKLIDETIQGA